MAVAVACLLVVLAVATATAADGATATSSAPAAAVDCTAETVKLADCLDYIAAGSAKARPSRLCCLEVRSAAKDRVADDCICATFWSADVGLTFNVSLVFQLPTACGVADASAFSKCFLALLTGNATLPPAMPPRVSLKPASNHGMSRIVIILKITTPITGAILALSAFCFYMKRRQQAGTQLLPGLINQEDIQIMESLILDLSTLKAATNNFDECNKLGEGGFGVVYKGTLPNGQVIAVKRLSHTSQQGIDEFKNEIVLVGKLQHKNLVRLVGVSLEKEKLLVYEYMPNRSLDTILFNQDRSNELDWEKRFKIINETARGLQYLHEESRLKIIHRDLKANNILLDSNLSPKISDFGFAKLFGGDQSHVITNRVAGTYGYMAPEYAMCGQYSVKSDVFSFGVILLEIVTGRRSMGSYNYEQSVSLLGLIWQHWNMGTVVDLIDPSLVSNSSSSQRWSDARDQMLRCMHIGLLCVQENPADRPMLSSVILMLRGSSTTPLQAPSRPAFWVADAPPCSSSGDHPAVPSANHVSVTELEAR